MAGNHESLPESFDAVILGTGLCESVLAAALSRIGHSVLHLDRNPYYGELEATHSLNNILDYDIVHTERLSTGSKVDCSEDEISINLQCDGSPSISNLSYQTYSLSQDELDFYTKVLRQEVQDTIKLQSLTVDSPQRAEASGDRIEESEQPSDSASPDNTEPDTKQSTTSEIPKEGSAQDEIDSRLSEEEIAKCNPVIKHYVKLEQDGLSSGDNISSNDRDSKLSLLKKHSNRFILDLAPKLLYARSEMIDLLITSDVARYCEFRTITQILTLKDEKSLQVVPCSRSDIFSTKTLSMIEKRILMKLLTLCMDHENKTEELQDYMDKPFVDFLKSQKLTPQLMNYVLHAIAMVPPTATTALGLERTQMFLKSLGRYGTTPFLWPLYGGEINQAFCRMSAVFGGVYILHRTISQIIMDKGHSKVESIICNEGMRISCKSLICNPDYLCDHLAGRDKQKSISRAIVITGGSLSTSDREEAVLLSIPSHDGTGDPVHVIELGPAACVCPKEPANLRIVHLTTTSKSSAEADLNPYVQQLFSSEQSDDKPRLLLACYFNIPDYSSNTELSFTRTGNMYVTPGPDANINPDHSVVEAKSIFNVICPGEEFLPRPPNPEDIIYCDDQSKKQSEGETFSEDQTEPTSQPDSGDTANQSKDTPDQADTVPDVDTADESGNEQGAQTKSEQS